MSFFYWFYQNKFSGIKEVLAVGIFGSPFAES